MPKRSQRSTSQGFTASLGELDGLSRRDFIRLNSALFLTAGIVGCSHPDDLGDDRKTVRVLRPDDLLSLRFDLHNLAIVHRYGKPSRLVRINPDQDALLLVGFPGQHVSEQTYQVLEETKDDPVAAPATALIAEPSRLVFRVPADVDALDLTLDALLDWQRLEAQLESPATTRVTPSSRQTRIEAPFGLVLSPDPGARWTHAVRPVTHAGRTELWHTRLLSGGPDPSTAVRILQPAREVDESQLKPEGFYGPLTLADRQDLYGKSAHARTLILSPVGGWLDLRGTWKEGSIARWEHQATAGQDQRIVIQRQDGWLYPFGHRATLMTVTEREVVAATWDSGRSTTRAAALRKRDFVVIKEPQRRYAHDAMAFQAMTAQVLVTPALEVADRDAAALWVETQPGKPYRFRFEARDWAGDELEFDAPAVFVSGGTDANPEVRAQQEKQNAAVAAGLYAGQSYDDHKLSEMRGQSAAVACFEECDSPDEDRWGKALEKPRSKGDTTLKLLQIRFSGDDAEGTAASTPACGAGVTALCAPEPPGEAPPAPPFACRTEAIRARVPSLEQFLNDDLNAGWFQRIDPYAEDNKAELFVVAQKRDERIPMYFDKQTERSGGLVSPSMDVDGLSRVLGPVGNRAAFAGELVWADYFATGRAKLLGSFSLIDLLSNADGSKSPIVPRVDFTVTQKEDKTEAGQPPAIYAELGVALTWTVPIDKGVDAGIVALAAKRKNGKSQMNLELAAGMTRAIGKPEKQEDNDDDKNSSTDKKQQEKPDDSRTSWSATARLKDFELQLKAGDTPLIVVGFDHLGIAIGPPEKPKADDKNDGEDQKDADADDEAENKKASSPAISRKIEHKISGVDAKGLLGYVQEILDATSHLPNLPRPPTLPAPEKSELSYPAKLPDIGSADVNVTVGPFKAPDFKWLQFDVSNVAVAVSMGFYFFARPQGDDKEPDIPANEFALRVADIDKPLTLLAEPWGGFAHLGLNFTTQDITAFQAGFGVTYKFTLDLTVATAACEGSLTGIFTYVEKSGKGNFEATLVLKLSGRATLWIADVYLLIVAIGQSKGNGVFVFGAEVHLNIKIGFFTASLRYSFVTTSGKPRNVETTMLGCLPAEEPAERMTETEWINYRTAFAGAS